MPQAREGVIPKLTLHPDLRRGRPHVGLCPIVLVYFLSPRVLRGPLTDRRETLQHYLNLVQFYNASPNIEGALPSKEFGGQNMQNFGRFYAASDFDCEYLRNGSRYPKSKKPWSTATERFCAAELPYFWLMIRSYYRPLHRCVSMRGYLWNCHSIMYTSSWATWRRYSLVLMLSLRSCEELCPLLQLTLSAVVVNTAMEDSVYETVLHRLPQDGQNWSDFSAIFRPGNGPPSAVNVVLFLVVLSDFSITWALLFLNRSLWNFSHILITIFCIRPPWWNFDSSPD